MVCSFFISKMKGVRKIATTGIWKIEKRLDNVIDYTTNIEKTINSDYGKDSYYDLHNVIDYVEADFKTEKQFYVSGVNCNPKTALEEMTITKEQYGKTGGILGFHAFQSFAEGEVTPEQCHAIGVRLAEEMWGDLFAYKKIIKKQILHRLIQYFTTFVLLLNEVGERSFFSYHRCNSPIRSEMLLI